MAQRLQDQKPELIRACELRREKCEQLRQKKKFAWIKAIAALEDHTKPIKTLAHLLKVKNLKGQIQSELGEILCRSKEVVPNAITPSELRTSSNKAEPKEYRPGPRTGAEAILKALLLDLEEQWYEFDVVKRTAQKYSEFSMFRSSGPTGRTAWTASNDLETRNFVEKDMQNKAYSARGGFGQRKAKIRLTDLGRQKANAWYGGGGQQHVVGGGQQHVVVDNVCECADCMILFDFTDNSDSPQRTFEIKRNVCIFTKKLDYCLVSDLNHLDLIRQEESQFIVLYHCLQIQIQAHLLKKGITTTRKQN